MTNPDASGQLIFIISGPSGAGKSTLLKSLPKEVKDLEVVLPITSRPLRKGEVKGVDSLFVSMEEFERMIDAGELLEWSKVYGTNYYGTPWSSLRAIDLINDILIELDILGKDRFISHFPNAITIFIMPPSIEETIRRVRERHDVPENEIQDRVNTAIDQVMHATEYKYTIVNNDIEETLNRMKEIIQAERYLTRSR